MKYLFILGRNPELSKAEVFAYLEREKIVVHDFSLIRNGLFVDLSRDLPLGVVDSFGGVISIGVVMNEGSEDGLMRLLDKRLIYAESKNNFSYVLWDFSLEGNDFCSAYLKKRFRSEKLKATEKPLVKFLEMQDGSRTRISGKVDKEYFIFKNDGIYSFGKIYEKIDFDALEKRDMGKPVRREELAVSPRLAKTMINLSLVERGEKMIDTFCGIGVVLFEGLLKGVKVLGIDVDAEAVSGALENLKWGNFNKENFEVLKGDSRKIKLDKVFGALVSEPDLGETFRRLPTKVQAKKSLEDFENLMIDVLNNFKKSVYGRFVFSAPYIQTMEKKYRGCDIEKILNVTGLKFVKGFPIEDYRKKQIVGRQIFVLER